MKNDGASDDGAAVPRIGWSDFAARRHVVGGGHSWFEGGAEEILARVRTHWSQRRPGAGRPDLTQVVIVPVSPDGFVSSTVRITQDTILHAVYDRRAEGEAGFVRVTAEGPSEEVAEAAVVLYAAPTLLENGGCRSGDFDWEIVCLLAGASAAEPMDPLTMARNMLAKPGGTPCAYTAADFAEAIWYWSSRASAHVVED